MGTVRPAIVAFDMDGTLLRGKTSCQLLADGLGYSDEMEAFDRLRRRDEVAAARATMTGWYRPHHRNDLIGHLALAEFAPGAREGIALLREAGIRVILLSISWHFAVEWVAQQLGVDEMLGTGWHEDGTIEHVWPEDKAGWLERELTAQGLSRYALAAIGDSAGDIPMLALAGTGYFVGPDMPPDLPHVIHAPGVSIDAIARALLAGLPLK